ncbi:MAG: biotin--[acetyl-CoA-carboxylase] ligase [Spartobacteria bacterium]|nr:biotin--[acetyl-CoA-carboxylase] ligase [Spartobacteria bacterium]
MNTTKADILQRLRAAGAEKKWLSSEAVCTELHITRAAVSKHVKSLKDKGYLIQSAPRRGYLFVAPPDRLFPAEIRHGLNTKIVGQQEIHYYETTESTNSCAKEAAIHQCPEGTLFVAETQSKGRGRMGRHWFSGTGTAICFSVVLRPAVSPGFASFIPLMAAVAVADGILEATGLQLEVKWPNDLLYEGKKAVGILVEASADFDRINHLIIGVGINVNTTADRWPDEVRNIATSLAVIGGRTYSRSDVLKAVLAHLEQWYEQSLKDQFALVHERWCAISCTLGRQVCIRQDRGDVEGVAEALLPEGGLLIRQADGTTTTVISGDIIRFGTAP